MFDLLDRLAGAWREIETVSAITGISIGLLLTLAALVYFDPLLRKVAVRLAIAILLGYGLLIGGYRLGAGDVRAQWSAANARAAAAAVARDKAVSDALEQKYQPQIAALAQQSADLQKQVESYEKSLLADKSAAAAGACRLGAAAVRLRNGR